MDRREELLNSECHKLIDDKGLPLDGSELILVYKPAAIFAMDEYMKECILEFIEYVAKNGIEINDFNGEVACYLSNGEGITTKQLFENFL